MAVRKDLENVEEDEIRKGMIWQLMKKWKVT
jgi:hypothetical protein